MIRIDKDLKFNNISTANRARALSLSHRKLLQADCQDFLLLKILTVFKRTLTTNGETDDGRTDTDGTLLDAGRSRRFVAAT